MVSVPTSIWACGFATRLWYQSGLLSAPALEAKTAQSSPTCWYIIGLTRSAPALGAGGMQQQQRRALEIAADPAGIGAKFFDDLVIPVRHGVILASGDVQILRPPLAGSPAVAPAGRAWQDRGMTPDSAPRPGSARTDGLWAERVGTRLLHRPQCPRRAGRDGPGRGRGVFTPGELLKIALAGCAGMSADHAMARRLGRGRAGHRARGRDQDTPTTSGTRPCTRNSSSTCPAWTRTRERDRVLTVVRRAIDRNCTVGRTLEHSTDVSLTISDASAVGAVAGMHLPAAR